MALKSMVRFVWAAIAHPAPMPQAGGQAATGAAASGTLAAVWAAVAGSPGRKRRTVRMLLAALALWVFWRYVSRLWRRQRVRLTYQETARNKRILSQCPSLRFYHPTPWLTNEHTMTVWGAVLRKHPYPPVVYDREYLPTEDGGRLGLDWVALPSVNRKAWKHKYPGTLVILHGLTGGSHEAYVQWMASAACAAGLGVVVMNARGCGGTELATPSGFSAAQTDDIRHTMAHVRARLGADHHMFAVGFSLGAGILTKYLGEEGYRAGVTAAASLCASYDMHHSTRHMEKPFKKQLYNGRLASNLRNWIAGHEHKLDGVSWLDLDRVYSASTVREFDEATIVSMFGYESVHDYYEDASSGRVVPDVRVPLLMLNAADDPIAAASGLPIDEVKHNPEVVLGVTDEGGHVAWCTGMNPRGLSWCEAPVMEWFNACASEAEVPVVFNGSADAAPAGKRDAKAGAEESLGGWFWSSPSKQSATDASEEPPRGWFWSSSKPEA